MASLTAKDKGEIAEELRVIATWVGGPRTKKVLALAARIEGLDAEQANEQAAEELAALNADTKLPEEPTRGKTKDKADA